MLRILFILFLLSSLFNFPLQASSELTVHVIGDSHSLVFDTITGCKVQWLGPITMHRVGRDGLDILALGVQESDAVVYVFGEIDVRCHIKKQSEMNNGSIEEIIQTLAIKYISTILQNRLLLKNLISIVYSIVPPLEGLNDPNLEFPFYGTLKERIVITKLLNEKLAVLCKQVGILFLDVYEDYVTPEGSLIKEFSDGNVHIHVNHNQAIKRKLELLLSQPL